MKRNVRQALALLAALIWGLGFSAQAVASAYMGPLSFNMYRSLMGFVFLLLLDLAAARLIRGRKHMFQLDRAGWRTLAAAGLSCGVMLFAACNLQQMAVAGSAVGKVGFLTAMYIVIVPVLGLFRGKRPTALLWGSVALAAVGMYFLCVTEGFSIARTDLYAVICALFYSLHILVIDHFSEKVDGIQMSCLQFLVVAVISGVCALFLEQNALPSIAMWFGPVLYAGVFSGGLAYTLQILAQKGANPTVVSLLLSMESVFAALGGALLLHQVLSGRELIGCGLMMVAVVLAQLPAADKSPAGETADP